jgi:hypothetical protein
MIAVRNEEDGVKPGFSMALHIRKFKSAMSEKCLLFFFEVANAPYVFFANSHRVSPPFISWELRMAEW